MLLPDFISITMVGQIATYSVMITQYVKKWLPDWAAQPAAGIITVGLAFIATAYSSTPFNWIQFLVNGGLAVAAAEFGWKFLNGLAGGTLSSPEKK